MAACAMIRAGRVSIGMVRPARVQSYAIVAVVGTFAAAVCFVAGLALYGATPDNWFVTIAGLVLRPVSAAIGALWH